MQEWGGDDVFIFKFLRRQHLSWVIPLELFIFNQYLWYYCHIFSDFNSVWNRISRIRELQQIGNHFKLYKILKSCLVPSWVKTIWNNFCLSSLCTARSVWHICYIHRRSMLITYSLQFNVYINRTTNGTELFMLPYKSAIHTER